MDMLFSDLLKKVSGNWELAITLFREKYGRLPTFDEYKRVAAENGIEGSTYLLNKAHDSMIGCAKSFWDWSWVYVICTQRRDWDLYYRTMERLGNLAQTFGEWMEAYRRACQGHFGLNSSLREKALTNLAGKGSKGQWLNALSEFGSDSDLKEMAGKEIAKTAQSFDDWWMVFWASNYQDTRALEQMSFLAKTYNDWKRIYEAAYGTDRSHLKIRATREMARLI